MRAPGELLKSFCRDRRGAVAMVFGVTLSLVVVTVGGAVDYGRTVAIRTQLQGMVDAAVAAGIRKYSETDNATGAKNYAENFFKELVNDNDLGPGNNKAGTSSAGANMNATLDTALGEMAGTATIKVQTPFLSLTGINELNVEVEATAGLAGKKLELSLMLDVTGSMDWYAGGTRKLDSLKVAAQDLLNIFTVNLANDATRIALVPFSEAVNVGSLASQVRGSRSSSYRFRRRYCSYYSCYSTYYLNNCVTERTGADKFTNEPPASGRWLGANYTYNGGCKPTNEIVPLSSDKNYLSGVINGFQATGGTAGHIGTAWAWYMLSEDWGYLFNTDSRPEAKDPDKLIKATILMTDGDYNTDYCNGVKDSTINCYAPNGSSKYQAEQLCDAMKDDDVVVYTVGFGISSGSSQEQLLKDCATDSTKYFFPYDGNALRAAFQEIGRQLAAGQAGVIIRK